VNRPPDGATNAPDEQLLADFLAGSDRAFTTLVERYSTELYQFVARFVRNQVSAEDIVQEAFVQVYQSAAGFDPARRFRPWLFTIAANKARDHLRGRGRKREVPLSVASTTGESEEVSYLDFMSDESATPSDLLEADERREVVRAIVSRMPENLREVLVLGYYHRFPYREISEILGVPLGTVKSRLHAAVSYFAEAYRQEEEKRKR
jgi:RNA polymerase sigma-70 factor, ECF subfamily